MQTLLRKLLMGLALISLAGAAAWAATVTSTPVSQSAAHDTTILVPLKLSSATPVAAINGEIQFDATLFSSPRLVQGSGAAANFTAMGNQTAPGVYKFLVYSDPVTAMNLTQTVAYLELKVARVIPHSIISQIRYTVAAAADANAVSLSTQFSTALIKLNSTAVTDWAVYE